MEQVPKYDIYSRKEMPGKNRGRELVLVGRKGWDYPRVIRPVDWGDRKPNHRQPGGGKEYTPDSSGGEKGNSKRKYRRPKQ